MIRKVISLITLTVIASNSFASGYSTWGNVQELYYGSDGSYLTIRMNVSDAQSMCAAAADKSYILQKGTDAEFYSQRISAILAAFHSQTPIRFYISGCDSEKQPIIAGVNSKLNLQ